MHTNRGEPVYVKRIGVHPEPEPHTSIMIISRIHTRSGYIRVTPNNNNNKIRLAVEGLGAPGELYTRVHV